MTEFSTARLNEALDSIASAVVGGFKVSDLPLVVAESMKVAEELGDVPGEKKREFAMSFASELIDRFLSDATPDLIELVRAIDVPLLPDWIEEATIDPIILKYAPLVVRAAVKLLLPGLFDLVALAAKGGLLINRN